MEAASVCDHSGLPHAIGVTPEPKGPRGHVVQVVCQCGHTRVLWSGEILSLPE